MIYVLCVVKNVGELACCLLTNCRTSLPSDCTNPGAHRCTAGAQVLRTGANRVADLYSATDQRYHLANEAAAHQQLPV